MIDAIRKFASASFRTDIQKFSLLSGALLNIVLCHVFITKMGLEEFGAAMAMNVTTLYMLVTLSMQILNEPSLSCMLAMPSMEIFNNMQDFVVMGLFTAMIVVFDWWAWAFLEISSGFISKDALGAFVIISNLLPFLCVISLGLSSVSAAFSGYYFHSR
jgi:Na+-driven multidrug efflux pump